MRADWPAGGVRRARRSTPHHRLSTTVARPGCRVRCRRQRWPGLAPCNCPSDSPAAPAVLRRQARRAADRAPAPQAPAARPSSSRGFELALLIEQRYTIVAQDRGDLRLFLEDHGVDAAPPTGLIAAHPH